MWIEKTKFSQTNERNNRRVSYIEVQNITKDYGNGKGIFDVSFNIEQGEMFGFVGTNGAGKFTRFFKSR